MHTQTYTRTHIHTGVIDQWCKYENVALRVSVEHEFSKTDYQKICIFCTHTFRIQVFCKEYVAMREND